MSESVNADETVGETTDNDDTELYTRRDALRVGAVGAATVAGLGSVGSVSAAEAGEVDASSLAFGSQYVQAPWINSTIEVDLTDESMGELDYTADDGSVASLTDDGVVLARRPTEGDPHNPVSMSAANFVATDDEGNVEAFSEFANFPRGTTYDDDSDSSTEEVAVSVLDASLWSTDNSASSGTLSVSDDGLGFRLSIGSQTSGDVALATFDLSTVGSSDATITSGVDRKFIQFVADVDTLDSGTTVEVRAVDSTGSSVAALIGSSVDTTTTAGVADSTGPSQVAQARVGELGTLDDIQKIQVAVLDGGADLKFHGLNAERESLWKFGTQESLDSDENIETVDIHRPKGEFSLPTLGDLGELFSGAAIRSVTYDVELTAAELPSEAFLAELVENPDTYNRPYTLRVNASFTFPSAYALTVDATTVEDEVLLPSGRYDTVEVATGVTEAETWEDVENRSQTSRTSNYSSIGKTVELLSAVSASDRTDVHFEVFLGDTEADEALSGSESGGAAVAGGGSGGPFSWVTVAVAALASFGVMFRKRLVGLFG